MENFKVNLEEFKVLGKELVEKVQEMIHAGNVRRIIIRDDHGHTFMEIPADRGRHRRGGRARAGRRRRHRRAPGALHHRRGTRPAERRRRTPRAARRQPKPRSEPVAGYDHELSRIVEELNRAAPGSRPADKPSPARPPQNDGSLDQLLAFAAPPERIRPAADRRHSRSPCA